MEQFMIIVRCRQIKFLFPLSRSRDFHHSIEKQRIRRSINWRNWYLDYSELCPYSPSVYRTSPSVALELVNGDQNLTINRETNVYDRLVSFLQ